MKAPYTGFNLNQPPEGPKINTRQAPNASENRRWRAHVTVLVVSWRVQLLGIITMQCSENSSQFLKRFAVSDISE